MPSFLKYRSSGRRVPMRARKLRRRRFARRRRPMTSGKVKRIIDAELKVRDLGVSAQALPTVTGQVIHVTNIGQGDTNTQRTGNWIKPVSFMGVLTVQGNTLANNAVVPTYRVGVICWKENQGLSAITLAQFMQDTSAPHQQYNIENKGQFKILWSRTGILSNDPTNPQFQKQHRFYVKPSLKVLYDGPNFKNNHLFVFAYSEIDTAANPPVLKFDIRLRYTDS